LLATHSEQFSELIPGRASKLESTLNFHII